MFSSLPSHVEARGDRRKGNQVGEKMIHEYIAAALERAHYELIDDEEPYYGEIPDLQGVWATGKSLEECRRTLAEVVDGWVLIRLTRGLSIPTLGQVSLSLPKEMSFA